MQVLYEDNHLLAVNKSVSELVQGDRTGDLTLTDMARQYIKEKYNKPGEAFIGLPHRLDRPVSGIVLFARTSKALGRLAELFREGKIEKHYFALVKERPPFESGILVDNLKKNENQNRSYAYNKPVKGSKEAKLSMNMLSRENKYYLLDIKLLTGRHHQIRCQLANAGCPIVGDLKYGYSFPNEDKGISLHAWKLSFIHPVKKEPVTIMSVPQFRGPWSNFRDTIKKRLLD